MDDALRDELLAAQEEHALALAAANAARDQLAAAHAERQSLRVAEPSAPPAAAERFVIEFHRNIGCYQAHVRAGEGAALPDARRLRVRVAFPNVALLLLKDTDATDADADADGDVWWTAEIERNVDEAACAVSVKEDHVHVRLPVKDGDRDVAGDGFASFSQIAAAELDQRSYARLACRACGSALVAPAAATGGSQFERALPLPSANWVDMFDFWGSGIGAFEHLPRDDIFAQEARVFVGEAHVLLHGAHVVPGSLVPAASERSGGEHDTRDWEPLACAQCAAALGARHRESAQTIRLDKHVLASAPAATDVFARYTVDSLVCAKLLEFADSDGVFRFALRSAAAPGAAPMLLQLLSWETTVKTERSPEFRRVLKVLYDASSSSHETAAQELRFPAAVCAAVAARLETSSALLPASLRSFNRRAVGFLFA